MTIEESAHPLLYAIALIVVVVETLIAEEYTVPSVLDGVVPSVVKRILASLVAVEIVTF